MSQHKVDAHYNNIPVIVLVGWDSPLRRFFLVIGSTNEEDLQEENDGYIYTNLLDSNLPDGSIHYQSIEYFESILEGLNIEIPDSVWQAVKQDKLANR